MAYSEDRLFELIDTLTECTGRLSRPTDMTPEETASLMAAWREGSNILRSALDEHSAEIRRSLRKAALVAKLEALREVTNHTIEAVRSLNRETSDEMSTMRLTQRAMKAYRRA